MQIKGLHKCIYIASDRALRQERIDKYEKLYGIPVKKWEQLKKEGVCDRTAQAFCGISRATYYRYCRVLKDLSRGISPSSRRPIRKRKSEIPEDLKRLVLSIRLDNPTYGKAKIAVIIKRDHALKTSESTVGRILKAYVEKGKITPSKSAFKTKRKRVFKKHAERWKYGMKVAFPGQLVQVDHMTVSKCSHSIKHFQAWDPSTKTIIAEAYSSATSRSAKKFLDKLIQDAPFPIQSIQVDGGSEFMLHFEEACHAKRISLYVLPPRRPQYNGGVERGNRTFREEFYSRQEVGLDAMAPLRQQLKQAVAKYNIYRPHASLKGLTPFEYTQSILKNTSCSLLSQTI